MHAGGRAAPDSAAHTGLSATAENTCTRMHMYRNDAGYIITGSEHHQAGGAQRVEGAPEGAATGRHRRGGAPVKR